MTGPDPSIPTQFNMSIPWQLKQDMAEIARQRGKSVTACWRDAVETLYAEELHKLRRQREDVA